WMVQLGFTIAVHWNSGDAVGVPKSPRAFFMVVGALAAGLLIAAIRSKLRDHVLGISLGEEIYRLFMSFYGLIFPAYVWLCMIPGRGRVAPTRWQWGVLAVSVVLAAPFYWIGFIERRMIWVLPGLGIVLAARALIRGKSTDLTPASGCSV